MSRNGLLKAIVACYLSNGMKPVDAGNDPRDLVGGDWFDSVQGAEDLEREGLLESCREPHPQYEGEYINDHTYKPTAQGIFEAL